MPVSFTFNGVKKDYLRVLVGLERPAWAPIEEEILEIPGRPGGIITKQHTTVRRLNIPVRVYKKGFNSLEELEEDLAAWLVTDEPKPLEFDHKPNRVYYAKVTGELIFTEYPQWADGVISFVCPDPYKYGPELEAVFPSDIVTLTNNGTAEADPIFELEVKKPVTFAMIANQDNEYMMIGQPADVDVEVVNQRVPILEERGQSLDEWYTPPGDWTGHFTTTGDAIVIGSWGEGEEWRGPALMREIDALDDYEIEMYVYVRTEQPNQTFAISTNFYDEYNNELGMLRIWDKWTGNIKKVVEARIGPYVGQYQNYLISDRNYDLRGQRVWGGIIRVRKEGNTFTFYTSRISQAGRHVTPLTVTYTDNEKKYAGRLKFVRFSMRTYGNTGTPNEIRIEHIKVTKLNKVEEDQTPYIAYPGDLITFDHKNADILINGESRADLKQLGASFFRLKKDENLLVVSPDDSFDVKCKYRPTYL